MNAYNKPTKKTVIGAALIGAAVGATAVMLKDKKNQEKVKKTVRQAVDKGKELKSKVEEEGKKMEAKARKKADESEETIRELEEEAKKNVYEPLERK